MADPRRRSPLSAPLRGAGYVIGLGLVIGLTAAAIAGVLVWILG